MINYSIYPDNFIFEGWDEFEPKYKEIKTADGIILMVEQINKEQLKIVQIISSNPQDYLRKELAPGNLIYYSLQL